MDLKKLAKKRKGLKRLGLGYNALFYMLKTK
jgi:hypothetical protein